MSTIYAIEVTPKGGDTGFLSMYHAYESLPDELREKIEGAFLKQDDGYAADGILRPGLDPDDYADVTTSPGPTHPIVRTHPQSLRKCLYLGKRQRAFIKGRTFDESEVILDALWDHTIREEFIWFNVWQPGDFLMWDNRCAIHMRKEFSADDRRILHRTQVRDTVAPA